MKYAPMFQVKELLFINVGSLLSLDLCTQNMASFSIFVCIMVAMTVETTLCTVPTVINLPYVPQVLPVSYVRFSTSPVLYTHTRESLKAFPLGIVVTFTFHFHASTGETLHNSNSDLTFSTNRSVSAQSLWYVVNRFYNY